MRSLILAAVLLNLTSFDATAAPDLAQINREAVENHVFSSVTAFQNEAATLRRVTEEDCEAYPTNLVILFRVN